MKRLPAKFLYLCKDLKLTKSSSDLKSAGVTVIHSENIIEHGKNKYGKINPYASLAVTYSRISSSPSRSADDPNAYENVTVHQTDEKVTAM
ncbi:hypothetical protein E1301_Tti015217 [Triplophysa tibetana]|uniref:Uncharacterized protein n=1 Tax=Triplophysa tibetana TaxID=1572043 RepID=A0A5A9NUY7_9TELE|nr:hypothetical protein E1301_Tti015217 [Triplophysa tibetana]